MLRSLAATLLLTVLGLVPSHAQTIVTASGGGASALTFTIHEQVTFESTLTIGNATLLFLIIKDAYTVDQSNAVNDAAFNTTTASITVPSDSATLGTADNAGIFDAFQFGPQDFFLAFSGDTPAYSIGDDLTLNPGTFTVGTGEGNFYSLPDNLANASLTVSVFTGGSFSDTSNTVANAIPEPATAGLLLLGGAALYLRRRPRR